MLRRHSLSPATKTQRRKLWDEAEEEDWPSERHPEFANRAPSPPPGLRANDPLLSGFLLKRHGSMYRHALAPAEEDGAAAGKPRFGRRFFRVDDQRGLLTYSHKKDGKPSLALALQDVTSVRALSAADAASVVGEAAAAAGTGSCFELTCSPYRLVLLVDGPEERCAEWVAGIEQRVKHWKRKAVLAGPPVAVPAFRLTPAGAAAPGGTDENASWQTPGRAW